jgi:hypothetical protein
MMENMHWVKVLLLLAGLCVGCASTETRPAMHARHSPSEGEFHAIDGRIVDLDLVATRASDMNSEIMTLITDDGNTYHFYTPNDIRCKSGTGNVAVNLGREMAIRVYMRPGNVDLALKQYMPAEWVEVECSK